MAAQTLLCALLRELKRRRSVFGHALPSERQNPRREAREASGLAAAPLATERLPKKIGLRQGKPLLLLLPQMRPRLQQQTLQLLQGRCCSNVGTDAAAVLLLVRAWGLHPPV
jgi:hypothetical protein